ncbi:MAG: type II toxin-antitoxin system VapC family toxin [Desulfurococcaceae archaeon]|nr:type II toxin-antitoxin system VapC family toxin [Desulfurococcaceae archaeon]MCC6057849.1 type II toxin-antitoxin system VapC family toxin [Desulfurococcaceae archaeon]
MIERVIDSSALAKFLLKEEGWKRVEEIIVEKPFTLDLAIKEVANAIWRRVVLLHDIDIEKVLTLLNHLLELKKVLRVEPQDQYIVQAFTIALENNIAVYDALFIAQAMIKKATLVTSDKRQFDVAQKLGVEATYI